jgi:hypothetical protein
MQKKAWVNFLLFKEFLYLFKKFITSGVFIINKHLLVLDGNGNNVTLKSIEYTQEFGLNMMTLPSHTLYVLQPLDVSLFKSFKNIFKKVAYIIMFNNNYMEPNKITMVR